LLPACARPVPAPASAPLAPPKARREPKAPLEWLELDLNRSLEANGVPDRRASYEAADLPGEEAAPVLHAYWNDDLTVA
jgi:hypothetical protein